MSQRSNKKQKMEYEAKKKGYNPKGVSQFWNKSIPLGYDFCFKKKAVKA